MIRSAKRISKEKKAKALKIEVVFNEKEEGKEISEEKDEEAYQINNDAPGTII